MTGLAPAAVAVALWLAPASGIAVAPQTSDGSAVVSSRTIDPELSQVRFTVYPIWQHHLDGRFDPPRGSLDTLADGRLVVRVQLAAASASFPDNATSTRWLRSRKFFDAAHYPWIRFHSQPFPATRLREGGVLEGVLELRGVSGPVRFDLAPGCADPGRACPIHAQGRIDRRAFGMTRMRWLVGDEVDFTLDVRLQASS